MPRGKKDAITKNENSTDEKAKEKVENRFVLDESLPDVVNAINKEFKTTKITTLSKAKSFSMKRYFSGSFGVDYLTGGGYAYKRILLLYGHKSSGKNSELYQMLAYNQRLCRHCHGVLPQYYEKELDRWTSILVNYLNTPQCICSKSEGKRFLLLDYEKSLGIEEPRPVIIRLLTSKLDGSKIDENTYNQQVDILTDLKLRKTLTEEQKVILEATELYVSNINVLEQEIQKIPETDYMTACGVNIDSLLVAEPKYTDEGIDMIKVIVKSKEVDGIIWDSLQAAIPKYVEARDAEENTMGVEAKMNGLLMRQIVSAFSADDLLDPTEAYKPTVFITSQVRSDIGAMYAKADTYSGGNALGHHIALALEVKREFFLDAFGKEAPWGSIYYGQRTRIRAEKNKLSSPGEALVYDYYFKATPEFSVGSIDHVGELMNLAINLQLIKQRGAYFDCNGQTFQGKNALRENLSMDPAFTSQLYKDILKRI
jgi:RecA/RadA recombinase